MSAVNILEQKKKNNEPPNKTKIQISPRISIFVCLPIFLSLDNQLLDVPMLNLLFDCIPPNPYALNTCNSAFWQRIERKKEIQIFYMYDVLHQYRLIS